MELYTINLVKIFYEKKKRKNINNIPNKISKECLNKFLINVNKRKEKNINEIDAFKLQKIYHEEIEELIEKNIYEKQDYFLYLKTAIKNMLLALIHFHKLEIENHNDNLRFESSNKWTMDKKSLMIALDLIQKVIVSKNDLDE